MNSMTNAQIAAHTAYVTDEGLTIVVITKEPVGLYRWNMEYLYEWATHGEMKLETQNSVADYIEWTGGQYHKLNVCFW